MLILITGPTGCGLKQAALALAGQINCEAMFDLDEIYFTESKAALSNDQGIGQKSLWMARYLEKTRKKAQELKKWYVVMQHSRTIATPFPSGTNTLTFYADIVVRASQSKPAHWDVVKFPDVATAPLPFADPTVGLQFRLMQPIDYTPAGEFGTQMYDILWDEVEWKRQVNPELLPKYFIDSESGISIADQLALQAVTVAFDPAYSPLSSLETVIPNPSVDDYVPVELTGTQGEKPFYKTIEDLEDI